MNSAKEAGFAPNRQNTYQIENNPSNGIQARIAELIDARFSPDVIDDTFIIGGLAKEAVSEENGGSVRVSALKALADIRDKERDRRVYEQRETMTASERKQALESLLWHSHKANVDAKTIDIEPVNEGNTPKSSNNSE